MKDNQVYFKLIYNDIDTVISIEANNFNELIEQQKLVNDITDVLTHIIYRGVKEDEYL